MLNAIFSGNIVADAEVKKIGQKEYYSIRVVSNNGKDKEGTFLEVLTFKGQTDMLQYYRKGANITAIGRLVITAYLNKNNIAVPSISIFANEVTINKFASDDNAPQGNVPAPQYAPAYNPAPAPQYAEQQTEDLPF